MSENKITHKTSVGGQALIEGIMMQGPKGVATAIRKPDGDILVDLLGQRALRALHGNNVVTGNGNRDASRDCDRMSSDTRHDFYLRFSVVDYQM